MEIEWSFGKPTQAGVYLRATARHQFYQQHRIINAEHGLSEGLWLGWGDHLARVDTLPDFYWFGPIPESP